MFPLRPSVPSTVLCSSTALYPLYGPLFTQQTFLLERLSISSAVHFPFWPSVSSTAICTPLNLYVPLYDTLYFVPSMVLSTLYDPLPPLRPSATSIALCPLYCPLSHLQLKLFSPLWPPVSSEALCPLYGPLSPQQPSVPSAKWPLLFREMFCKTRFVKTPRVVAIYFVLAMIAIITIIIQAKYSAIITK